MFSVIWMLIIGLIVGGLAKLIMPGRDPGGIFVTMMLGVAGAMVSGLIGRLLGSQRWNSGGKPPAQCR
jgi:uncharacterized membrane protein YeaQ/YmgE (transglycosylase-associated protein family)